MQLYSIVCVLYFHLLGNQNIRFGELLANEDDFKHYLVDTLGINQTIAQAIVDSTIHTDVVSYYMLVCMLVDYVHCTSSLYFANKVMQTSAYIISTL